MRITEMYLSASSGAKEEKRAPVWKDIASWIRKLNGDDYVEVGLIVSEGIGMQITGGYRKRYLVQIITQDSGNTLLLDPSASRQRRTAITAYDEAVYPEYWTVPQRLVLEAARHYAENGNAAPSLSWSR